LEPGNSISSKHRCVAHLCCKPLCISVCTIYSFALLQQIKPETQDAQSYKDEVIATQPGRHEML